MHIGRWIDGFGCYIMQIKSYTTKKQQRHDVGLTAFCLMNLGKLILVLRDVLDWSIILLLTFLVLDMANIEMA
jgi:hypothetical protein